jgi:prepilin-type processing-associated H-X9-DG protein
VIGIIAVLVGILLPVLGGVQTRGRDIKCQSNLRQVVQAMHGYAAENKGSMPYGFYWSRSRNTDPDPYSGGNDWGQAPGNSSEFVSWASLVGKYMVRGASGNNDEVNFPPVLKCPEADMAFPHVVSYAMNWIVGISPYDELRIGPPPRAQLKPPPITLMMPHTAVVWDTAVQPGWEQSVGFLLGADIDSQRFWEGARTPQMRYYTPKDPFAQLPPGNYGSSKPIQLSVSSFRWYNIDPQADTHYPYQGNLRFRHGKNTRCNVGFADGSVRSFTVKLRPDKSVIQHDALRRNFMIKWPPGVPANTELPH